MCTSIIPSLLSGPWFYIVNQLGKIMEREKILRIFLYMHMQVWICQRIPKEFQNGYENRSKQEKIITWETCFI